MRGDIENETSDAHQRILVRPERITTVADAAIQPANTAVPELIRQPSTPGGKAAVDAVLSAAALGGFLRGEPGAGPVAAVLPRSCISAVNLAEVIGRMAREGKPIDEVAYQIERLGIEVVPFDAAQAEIMAELWTARRYPRVTYGNLICLALAVYSGLPAVFTDGERTMVTALDQCEDGLDVEIAGIG